MVIFGTNIIAIFFIMLLATDAVHAGLSVDLESGLAYSGYNDVRIPGST